MRLRASTKARTCRSIGFGTRRTVDRRLRNLPGESGVVGACRRLHTGNHTFDRRFLGHAESGGSRHGRLDHISLSHNRWNPTRFGRTANRRQQRIPHSLFRHKKSGRPTGSGPRQRRNRKGVTPVFGKHLIHRLISVLIRNRGILQQTIVSSILLYRHNQINN